MSFNTYPQNPFPSSSELLQKLDEVAKAVDDMPTFTSNDKAFLNELPAFPSTDGVKVLTATTESGETSLSYEEIESELPAEPSDDGVKVLTATTESGETVLSWETQENELPAEPSADGVKVLTATTTSGETVLSWEDTPSVGVDYSTTEQNTGVKWIDGKDIYRKVVDLGALPNNTIKTVAHGITNISRFIKIVGTANSTTDTTAISIPLVYDSNNASNNTSMKVNGTSVLLETHTDRSGFNECYAILHYTKTSAE